MLGNYRLCVFFCFISLLILAVFAYPVNSQTIPTWYRPGDFYDPPCVYPLDYGECDNPTCDDPSDDECEKQCSANDPCYGWGSGNGEEHYKNPLYAFDGAGLDTFAYARVGSGISGQQCRIYFTFDKRLYDVNEIRFYVSASIAMGGVLTINISRNGQWITVYADTPPYKQWYNITFESGSLDEIKFSHSKAVFSGEQRIYDVMVWGWEATDPIPIYPMEDYIPIGMGFFGLGVFMFLPLFLVIMFKRKKGWDWIPYAFMLFIMALGCVIGWLWA